MACDCSALRSEILSQRQLMIGWFETLMSELKDVKCQLNSKFNSFNVGEQYSTTAQPVISEPFSASVVLTDSYQPDNILVSSNSASTSCSKGPTTSLEPTISPEIATTAKPGGSEPAFEINTDFFQPKIEPIEETSNEFAPLQIVQQSAMFEDETISVSIDSMNVDETNNRSWGFAYPKELPQTRQKRKQYRSKNIIRCKQCDYETTCAWHFKRHSLTHTGEKPFSCDVCGYKCRSSWDLLVHKRRRHTGEKPFACDQCDLRFCTNTDLGKHQRIHTGEKPLKCELCGFKSAHHSALNYHTKHKHKELNTAE